MSFGALYPVLHKLEQEGLIEGQWEEAPGTKRRKVYALTAAGRKTLNEERAQFEAFTGAVGKLLGQKA